MKSLTIPYFPWGPALKFGLTLILLFLLLFLISKVGAEQFIENLLEWQTI